MDYKIMVVDDDAFFRKFSADLLRKHCYQVVTASSWMDFTKSLHQTAVKPDLIIIDINLGGVMSGDKIIKAIKKEEKITGDKYKKTKLVLISSCPEEEIKAKAEEVGADGYILKDSLKIAGGAAFLNKVRTLLLTEKKEN
ncbi:MAG: response regulator [Acidobacteria bacterium]|nr:response regulator [Acidobacteriota bacterium]